MDDVWKLLTLLIACGVAYVAYQQYLLGRAKFKLDLFEKRFAVFDATRKLLGAMASDGPGELEKVHEFRVAVTDAQFLFCSDVTDYLNEIDSLSGDHYCKLSGGPAYSRYRPIGSPTDHARMVGETGHLRSIRLAIGDA